MKGHKPVSGIAAGLLAAMLLASCATNPADRTTDFELATIDAAAVRIIGSSPDDDAPAEAHEARKRLTAARQAARDGDYRRVQQLRDEAVILLELAQAKIEARQISAARKEVEALQAP